MELEQSWVSERELDLPILWGHPYTVRTIFNLVYTVFIDYV